MTPEDETTTDAIEPPIKVYAAHDLWRISRGLAETDPKRLAATLSAVLVFLEHGPDAARTIARRIRNTHGVN